jgi:glycosyltransferase involved in cell wall biosynthesis
MRINIIVATWNSDLVIRGLLSSLVNQKASPFALRLIIKDNESTDGTLETIHTYQSTLEGKGFEVIINNGLDSGIYSAWNLALKENSFNDKDLVLFIGSDDYFADDYFYLLSKEIINANLNVIFFSDIYIVDSKKIIKKCYNDGCHNYLQSFMSIPHPSVIMSFKALNDLEYFDENFKIAGDYDMVLRCFISEKYFFKKLNIKPSVYFSLNGVSSNPKTKLKTLREKLNVKLKNNLKFYYLLDWRTFKSFFSFCYLYMKLKLTAKYNQ